MADQDLVSWLKQQMKAGYKIDYLRDYLIKNGYDPKAVEEAVASIGQEAEKKSKIGFIVTLIAGFCIIIFQILNIFMGSLIKPFQAFLFFNLSFIDTAEIFGSFSWIFNLIIGVIIILAGFVIHKQGKEIIGGTSVLALCVIALITGNPLIFIVIGILGGALGLFKK